MNNLKYDELPYGLLPDWAIAQLARQGMISPFEPKSIKEIEVSGYPSMEPSIRKVLSYGCSHYGFDIRLSPKDFKIFRHVPGNVINPKRFNPKNLESVELQKDADGEFFIIPGHSYGLGVSLERFDIPPDVITVAVGKSTYARCALAPTVTPFEPGWNGYATLEFTNSSPADVRIYANEGCVQILFFRNASCLSHYGHKNGKYQGQPEEIVLARV